MTSHDAIAVPAPPSPDQLPDDPLVLKAMIAELVVTLQQCQHDLQATRDRLDRLLQRLYGPRTERIDPNQPLLFGAPTAAADQPTPPVAAPEPTTTRRRCRPHGRRRLPANLPREPRHHELTQAERLCPDCGQTRIDIGVDKSEQLDYKPASLFVIEHFVHKYACPCCSKAAASALEQPRADVEVTPPHQGQLGEHMEPSATPGSPEPVQPPSPPPPAAAPQDSAAPTAATAGRAGVVVSASKPPMPIAKGLPGPGLLAHLIVSKYTDHLPLYRLERVYERQGFFLPRSTSCDWLAACARLLQPLDDLMVGIVLQSRVLHTDDTPVQIHDPPPGETDIGRLWAYLGDAAHPYNVFDFTPNRKRDGPQQFLKNFRGYLQADAFSGYDALYLPQAPAGAAVIHEVACHAHARRKFYDARTSDSVRAHQALGYYRQLYELERGATALDFDDDQRLRMRQDFAVPILAQFQAWLLEQQADVLPKSPLGEAIGYALHNWSALVRYTEAGFLAIDNNVAEREMKRIAIGRKNWLFVGSVAGGDTAAVLMTFTSTCHRLGVEPWAYLQDVLTRLPSTPAERLAELLPDRWQAARTARTDAGAGDNTSGGGVTT